MFELEDIVRIITGLVIVFLFFMTHSYIEKLERIGCPCSEHPDRKFIKGFSLFAIIYILLTMFIPSRILAQTVGMTGMVVFGLLKFIFVVLVFAFFIISIRYTQHLITEKCKCSEDYRREALYYWSIIHMVLLVILVIVPIFSALFFGGLMVGSLAVTRIHDSAPMVHSVMVNPVKHVSKIPASIKASAKASAKAASKLMKKRR